MVRKLQIEQKEQIEKHIVTWWCDRETKLVQINYCSEIHEVSEASLANQSKTTMGKTQLIAVSF